MVTADNLKRDIKNSLYKMVDARIQYLLSYSILDGMGVNMRDNSRLYLGDCCERVTEKYLKDLCKKLSSENAGGTLAQIELKEEAFKIISCKIANRMILTAFRDHDESGNEEADRLLVETYLNAVDFNAIADSINHQAKELFTTGLNVFAKEVIKHFNLAPTALDGYYKPHTKANKIICPVWAFNYHNYDSIRKISELITIFAIIGEDAGLSLCAGLREYYNAAQNLHYGCEKIASRSCFGKGTHIEIHCFKDKHEFRFSHQAFEAILAFISLNGESETADNIIGKTQLLEAA